MTDFSSLRGRKVLVTGGAGFIGSHTVQTLVAHGAEVTIVDNLLTGRQVNIPSGVCFHHLNIAEERLSAILQHTRPHIIYHLAFHVLVPKSIEDPLCTTDGLVGSIRLFEAARRVGVQKIILASSGFLYGNSSPPPCTKNVPSILSRPTSLPSPRWKTTCASITRPMACPTSFCAMRRSTGQDRSRAPWPSRVQHRHRVETTLNDLYRRIATLLGAPAQPIYRPDRSGEQLRYVLDASKARREMGWIPRATLDEGLRLTVSAALARRPDMPGRAGVRLGG